MTERRIFMKKLFTPFLFLMLGLPVFASAETYYLKQTGTATKAEAALSAGGTCSGTSGSMSIATHNADTFSNGDIILLCDNGTIDFDDTVLPVVVPSSGLTYKPNTGETIVLDGTNFASCGKNYSGIVIDGKTDVAITTVGTGGTLTVQNMGSTNCTAAGSDSSGIYFNGAASGSVNTVTISNSGDQNIQIAGSAGPTVTLTNITSTDAQDDGVSCHAGNLTISGGTLSGNSEGVGTLSPCTILADGVTFTNNVTGFTLTSNNTTIQNSTFNIYDDATEQKGIQINSTSATALIKDNTFNLVTDDGDAFYATGIIENGATYTATVQDNTFVSSVAKKGRGILVSNGTLVFSGSQTCTNVLDCIYKTSAVAMTVSGLIVSGSNVGVNIGGANTAVANSKFSTTDRGISTLTIPVTSNYNIYILDSGDYGIYSQNASGNITANNNTFSGSSNNVGTGIYLVNATGADTITNNIFYDLAVGVNSARAYTYSTCGWYSNAADRSGAGTATGSGTQITNDPLFISPTSDFRLQPTSPAIEAGTAVSSTTDYLSNSIYGVPDIGAYEYQPPYTIGTNDIPTTGSARIYSDGKYRMTTASSTSVTADLTVTPQGGSYYATTTQYMDLTIDTWNTSGDYAKQWTATSTAGSYLTHATSTVYTIGDLNPTSQYTLLIDGTATTTAITDSVQCTNSVCIADSTGQIQFTYVGGYSTHIFGLEDVTAPTLTEVTAISSPTSDNTPSYTFSSDESGTILYAGACSSGTTSITANTNTTITFSTLSDGTYTDCRISVIDVVGNNSATTTLSSFTVDTSTPSPTVGNGAPVGFFGAVNTQLFSDTTTTTTIQEQIVELQTKLVSLLKELVALLTERLQSAKNSL